MSAEAPPTDREVLLARGFLALLRTHESAGDPAMWELSRADWGDGRETIELHRWSAPADTFRTRGLVCQFRPDDIDGTIELAEACVSAVQAAADIAADVLRASGKPAPTGPLSGRPANPEQEGVAVRDEDTTSVSTDTSELRSHVLDMLRAGKCPDGGGPHCVCRLREKELSCASLAPFKICKACADDGFFRIGMSSDICGDCMGTKILDGEILDAVLSASEAQP